MNSNQNADEIRKAGSSQGGGQVPGASGQGQGKVNANQSGGQGTMGNRMENKEIGGVKKTGSINQDNDNSRRQ